jgi:hypothetical protein
MKKYGDGEKLISIFLRIYTFSVPLNMIKWVLKFHLFVYMYVCMCPSLVPEWLDGFYSYSIFKSLTVRSVPR